MTERASAARLVDFWSDVVRRCPEDLGAAPAAVLGRVHAGQTARMAQRLARSRLRTH